MTEEINTSLPSSYDSQFSCGKGEQPQCRICHNNEPEGLISPCYCSGSMKYVHQTCLEKWIKISNINSCELCKFQLIMRTMTKPFWEREPLKFTGCEWWKLIASVSLNTVVLISICWLMYSFKFEIDKGIRADILNLPLGWRKIAITAMTIIWISVAVIYRYKLHLRFHKTWKELNRVILIQNFPRNELEYQVHEPTIESSMSGDTVTESSESSITTNGYRNEMEYQVHEPTIESSMSGDTVTESSESSIRTDGYFRDKTSIDLKEICSEVFFLDENDDRESQTSEEAAEGPSWRIKSGKAESLPSQRFNGNEAKGTAEIGITCSREGPESEMRLPSTSCKDISDNIKIDDDIRDPIVIVKKNPSGAESKAHFQVKFIGINEEEYRTEDGYNNYQKAYSDCQSDSASVTSLPSNENGLYTDQV